MDARAFAALRATYVEAWPAAWRARAGPQALLALDPPTARAMLRRSVRVVRAGWTGARDVHEDEALARLAARVEPLVRAHGRAFVRLGSRSAKDSARAVVHGLAVDDGGTAVDQLTSGSRRVIHDLRLALAHDHVAHVVVRPWRAFPAWAELRCFVRGGRFVGASQHGTPPLRHVPELARHAADVHALLAAFVAELAHAAPLGDFVADVVLDPSALGRPGTGASGASGDAAAQETAWLVDVNPFGVATDAALFTWADGGDFDGTLRHA